MSSEGVTVTGAEESSTGANPKPPEPRIPCGWKEYPVFESFDDYELDENLLRPVPSAGVTGAAVEYSTFCWQFTGWGAS